MPRLIFSKISKIRLISSTSYVKNYNKRARVQLNTIRFVTNIQKASDTIRIDLGRALPPFFFRTSIGPIFYIIITIFYVDYVVVERNSPPCSNAVTGKISSPFYYLLYAAATSNPKNITTGRAKLLSSIFFSWLTAHLSISNQIYADSLSFSRQNFANIVAARLRNSNSLEGK